MRHVLLSKCGWFHHTAIGNPVIQLLKLFTKFYNLGNLFHKVNLNPCSKYYHHFQMVECINDQLRHHHFRFLDNHEKEGCEEVSWEGWWIKWIKQDQLVKIGRVTLMEEEDGKDGGGDDEEGEVESLHYMSWDKV